MLGYVLPRFQSSTYKLFALGKTVGIADFAPWYDHYQHTGSFEDRPQITRRFTLQCLKMTDMLALSGADFLSMRIEFPLLFKELLTEASNSMKSELMLKLDKIGDEEAKADGKYVQKISLRVVSQLRSNLESQSSILHETHSMLSQQQHSEETSNNEVLEAVRALRKEVRQIKRELRRSKRRM